MPVSSLILASASPRRSALLDQLGVPHRVRPVAVDESARPGEDAQALVQRLARAKAQAGQAAYGGELPVLGADTLVALGDTMLGQPRDRAEAMAMLERLSGRVHRVYSAVALAWDNAIALRLSKTEVSFGEITPAAMAAYWASGEPADKAGGYGIQGLGAAFVRRIEGSYSGVMGLPLYETAELLSLCGLDPLRTPPEGAEHERP